MYELAGRAHAALVGKRGQATVEYVGLVLLVAVLVAGIVAASARVGDDTIARAILTKLKAAITGVGAER